MSVRATRPAAARFDTAASAATRRTGTRASRRPPAHSASWPPAECPATPTLAQIEPRVAELGERVDAVRDVLERLRPASPTAAPVAEPPVLEVPHRDAVRCEVAGRGPHDELAVARLPVAAVQQHHDRERPAALRNVQVGHLRGVGAVAMARRARERGGKDAKGERHGPRHATSPDATADERVHASVRGRPLRALCVVARARLRSGPGGRESRAGHRGAAWRVALVLGHRTGRDGRHVPY